VSHGKELVTRHVMWQAVLAVLGIVAVFFLLLQLGEEPETVEVPAVGGTFVEAVVGYSETINPILAPQMVQGNPADQDLSALVFDGLTQLDPSGTVIPALATEWTISDDGMVYDFLLRRDVTWHDGAPLTATDVAFTIQALQDPGYAGDANLAELWRRVLVEQVDAYTVRFTLEEPLPSFLFYTTIGVLPAHLLSDVPAAQVPTHRFSTENPVGTGPFMVEAILPDRVVLAAYPDYWDSPVGFLDRLEFWFYAGEEALLTDQARGDIHGFHPVQPGTLASAVERPDLQLYSAMSAGYGIVYLNLQRESVPSLQEKEVRQALLYAMDRQSLIDGALAGQGLVADSPIPPTMWAYDAGVREYGYDPERAIGLLDASGWLDSDGDRIRDREGQELAFSLLTTDDAAMVQMAEQIAEYWREVGVDAEVHPVEAEQIATFIRDRDFDAALVEVGLTADPDPYPLWHSTQASEGGQNFAGFANLDADMVMEEGRVTVDRERRTGLYHSFQQIFAEEVPSLLIYYPVYIYAVDEQVRDVQLAPLLLTSDRFRNIADWYMETEELAVTEIEELDKAGE
jgi:peptide/nickel transport system substrate-binding protein